MWFLVACQSKGPSPTTPEGAPPGDTAAPTNEDDTGITDVTRHSATPTTLPSGVVPPLGGTSGGDGGVDFTSAVPVTAGGAEYRLLAPRGSDDGVGVPFLLVISGTEGADVMMANLVQTAPVFGLRDAVLAVLDGRTASAQDLEAALDDVRAAYDIDNDRTWLLSESAGTRAGLEVGLDLRQSYFAAFWANDVNARATPAANADALGFAPWGNAGPGGDLPDAQAIVVGMADAGYRLPADAPYSGPGSTIHGDSRQFLAAVQFFSDKVRDN